MKYIILIGLLTSSLFAVSPFSLEGLKNVNIKVADKSRFLSKKFKQKVKQKLNKELNKAGITTYSEEFSNFIIKIEAVKIQKAYVVNISLFIVEDIIPSRNKSLQSLGITYKQNDFFDADDLEDEVYESIINYLLIDFIEQYKEESS